MAIQSKYSFNNFKKVKYLIRVYKMVNVLYTSREIGSRKLIELTIRFYGLYFSDYKSIADFSNQLS
jgi:hypothetical protein